MAAKVPQIAHGSIIRRGSLRLLLKLRIWGLGVRVSPGAPGFPFIPKAFRPAAAAPAGCPSGASHAIPTHGGKPPPVAAPAPGRPAQPRAARRPPAPPARKRDGGAGQPADTPSVPLWPRCAGRRPRPSRPPPRRSVRPVSRGPRRRTARSCPPGPAAASS